MVAKPTILPPDCIGPASGVTDSKVIAVTRELCGPRFEPCQQDTVRSVLEAGLRAGYQLVRIDHLTEEPGA